jgi:LAO/AO transport system kinase
MRQRLRVDEYTQGILSGDRILLSRAITIIESTHAQDRALAREILAHILPFSGKSIRVGITGVPGAGKSTFIEALGTYLTSLGKTVGVLTVDPTSKRSGGSILGDKTRMEKLSHNPRAYIRPSPAGNYLGGVAHKTRETLLLCEAAGYDVILIETVGVGQSETVVHSMTDFFLLLMITGAGDDLQGIKRGVLEMADAVIVNKADGENAPLAERAVNEFKNALHLFQGNRPDYTAHVMAGSALEGKGIPELWAIILSYYNTALKTGYLTQNRQAQNLDWMYEHIRQGLETEFYENRNVQGALPDVLEGVHKGNELPGTAAEHLLKLFLSKKR